MDFYLLKNFRNRFYCTDHHLLSSKFLLLENKYFCLTYPFVQFYPNEIYRLTDLKNKPLHKAVQKKKVTQVRFVIV